MVLKPGPIEVRGDATSESRRARASTMIWCGVRVWRRGFVVGCGEGVLARVGFAFVEPACRIDRSNPLGPTAPGVCAWSRPGVSSEQTDESAKPRIWRERLDVDLWRQSAPVVSS